MLKSWSIADFDVRTNLVDGVSDWWTQVGTTAEYYYNQANITAKPQAVYIDGALAPEGTVTELVAGEWGWDGTDLFVRIEGDGDPDAQASGYIEAREAEVTKTLLDSTTNTITTFSLLVSNNSEAAEANVKVERTGSDDVTKFSFPLTIAAGNSPVAIDSSMIFTGGDKLVVTADAPDVSVDTNGEES